MIITTTKYLPTLLPEDGLVRVIMREGEFYYYGKLKILVNAKTGALTPLEGEKLVLIPEDSKMSVNKNVLLEIAPAILEAEGKCSSRDVAGKIQNAKPPFEIVSMGEPLQVYVIDIEGRFEDWKRLAQQLKESQKKKADVLDIIQARKKALEKEVDALLEELQIPDELLEVKKITPSEFLARLEEKKNILKEKGVEIKEIVVEEVEPNSFKVSVTAHILDDTISERAAIELVKEYLAGTLGELYDETGIKAVVEDAVVKFV